VGGKTHAEARKNDGEGGNEGGHQQIDVAE